MATYSSFTSLRTTPPDGDSLLAALRAVDATAGWFKNADASYTVKTSDAPTALQLASMQTAIDTAPASTPQLTAQAFIDRMPIFEQALLLSIIDELNRRRDWDMAFKAATASATSLADLKTRVAALPDAPDITVAQAIAAVRAKAGTI